MNPDEFIGQYCIIKTTSQEVFTGIIIAFNGNCRTLVNAQRLVYWDESASLSQLSQENKEHLLTLNPVEIFSCSHRVYFLVEPNIA